MSNQNNFIHLPKTLIRIAEQSRAILISTLTLGLLNWAGILPILQEYIMAYYLRSFTVTFSKQTMDFFILTV